MLNVPDPGVAAAAGVPPHAGPAANARIADDRATLAALGVIAYVSETLGHEAIGHGGLCLLHGGRISALAPLWMRCSVQSLAMVAAGPILNLVMAALCAVVLMLRRRSDTLSYLVWLCCAFNALVACGYMIVGGATTFGDWGVLFASVEPSWLWRAALVGVGVTGYLAALMGLGALYRSIAGVGGLRPRKLATLTLVPATAAAVVACAAELAGRHVNVGALPLALGCTIFVGWNLGSIRLLSPGDSEGASPSSLTIPFQPAWLVAGAATAVGFIWLLGRAAP